MVRLSLLALLLPALLSAQDPGVRYAGSRAPDSTVIELAMRYGSIMSRPLTPAIRDSLRAGLVTDGYFYQGLDGTPIGLEGLTARQTRNEFQLQERSFQDVVLHQHENTALVTYKLHSRGEDRGEPFDDFRSGALVLTRTADGWRVAADILGQDPPHPAESGTDG